MTPNPRSDSQTVGEPDTGAGNVERLLEKAYRPEVPDAAFVQRVEERLLATARELAKRRALTTTADTTRLRDRERSRAGWVLGAAAVAGMALIWHGITDHPLRRESTAPAKIAHFDSFAIGATGLTARSRPPAPASRPLAVGATVRTQAGERQRVLLPDGSVLYVNQNSTLTLTAPRQIALISGEVFAEVARQEQAASSPFIVKTPTRAVAALGTKFDVRTEAAGTGVLVTQGKVTVSGCAEPLLAGQRLNPGAVALDPAPRASYALAWAKELMTQAESPLVPASTYSGGALVAADPNGQVTRLSLRTYHIDVHIEDGFARTTIDQTYFNDKTRQLEGTFYFPLPPDASLSRLAMYVDGKLMEGGMAEREHARNVYEQILYTRRDPALLEWVDGSTFKMRVFPLEGRQEKRIVLSYTQRLSSLYGRLQYRFPAGHSLESVRAWSFRARVKDGKHFAWRSDAQTLRETWVGNDLLLNGEARNVKVNRDVALDLLEKNDVALDRESARFSSAEHERERYLMLRYRPGLPGKLKRERRDWVIVFESAADRDPLLARAQVEIVRHLLANADHDDTFAVLTAGTRVRALSEKLQPIGVEHVTPALEALDQTHLIGALDLGGALDAAGPFVKAGKNPYLVHIGGGLAALGERRQDVLLKRLPPGARYIGVGVGKRWSRSFMKSAAEQTGGAFTQINPDEPIAWRAFELAATLNAPRLLDVKVIDETGVCAFLPYATSIAQGEEICAMARVDAHVKDWPTAVTITGTLDGKPFQKRIPVQQVAAHADYLPRTWARLEIDRLLAENVPANKEKIVSLSKDMYVMTPYTSLLVLENEAMYKQFHVDRGRKDHWAIYPCPETIPVVKEPLPEQLIKDTGPKPTHKEILQTIVQLAPRIRLADITDGTSQTIMFGSGRLSNEEIGGLSPVPWGERGVPNGGMGIVVSDCNADSRWFIGATIEADDRLSSSELNALGYYPPARALVVKGTSLIGRADVAGSMSTPTVQARFFSILDRLAQHDENIFIPLEPPGPQELFRLDSEASTQERIRQLTREHGFGAPSSRLTGRSSFDIWKIEASDRSESSAFRKLHARLADDLLEKQFGAGYVGDSLSKAVFTLSDESYPDFSDKFQGLALLPRNGLLYDRPTYRNSEYFFAKLLAFAPGLDTSLVDVLATLEAESAESAEWKPGTIDPPARDLIERARKAGWQTLIIPAEHGRAAYPFTFDGSGRYAYMRTLSDGLVERVVCDGTTLTHLYPEIGVGARRNVSRFQRAQFSTIVPWLPPPVNDLARGADVKCLADRVVAIIPHAKPVADQKTEKPEGEPCVHLLFAPSGELAERRIVAQPSGKILSRVRYAKGSALLFDADGRELARDQYTLHAAAAPDLQPGIKNLVVIPMPWRTVERVQQLNKIDSSKSYRGLPEEKALALLAAFIAVQDKTAALDLWRQCFEARGDKRLGFYTLLASCGWPARTSAQGALAEYLGRFSLPQTDKSVTTLDRSPPADGLLARLTLFHDLLTALSETGEARTDAATLRKNRDRAVAFVRENAGTPLGWAMLLTLLDEDKSPAFQHELAGLCALFENVPGLAYAAKYERARCLHNSGRLRAAQEVFSDLYTTTFNSGVLPPLDAAFVLTLSAPAGNAGLWTKLIRQSAATLAEKKQHPALIALAWQCRLLGDPALANEVFTHVLATLPDTEQPLRALPALAYLWNTEGFDQAENLFLPLLNDKKLSDNSSVWRLGAAIAEKRGEVKDAAERLEKALDLEYLRLSERVDLEAIRTEYGKLLTQYQKLADHLHDLNQAPSSELVARIVRVADRWRGLDTEPATVCQSAAQILATLGARELANGYLSSLVAFQPGDSAQWLSLARSLSDDSLADQAYALAYNAEPANAQILWERAVNLQRMGRAEAARDLVRQIATGTWASVHGKLQEQARERLRRPDF